MLCKNCGQPVTAQATFCGSCGQTVAAPEPVQVPAHQADTCVNCGAELLPDSLFCAECGHKVAQVAEDPAPVEAPEWSVPPEMGDTAETETETSWPSEPEAETDQPNEMLETEDDHIPETDVVAADVLREVDEPHQTEQLQTEDDGLIADEDTVTAEIDETEDVTAKCPSCDALLLPEAVFCAECGHRLT